MKVLTENELRIELKNKDINKYFVDEDTIVTPSAKQYLSEKGIELVIKKKNEDKEEQKKQVTDELNEMYYNSLSETYFKEKPEFMTHLHGKKIVFKDHPRIILRGKLDSLQAKILEVQIYAVKNKLIKLNNELEEILKLVRNILRAEVLDEEIEDDKLLGLSEKELREISQHPMKYLNSNHIVPNHTMGETVILLNTLRSMSREVEINAIQAFKGQDEVIRQDIIRALNRLSSCFYIMMIKANNGSYK